MSEPHFPGDPAPSFDFRFVCVNPDCVERDVPKAAHIRWDPPPVCGVCHQPTEELLT